LVKPATEREDRTTAEKPATDPTRAFADAFAMNPLVAQSAAAMAAATAVGLNIAGQFANAFFGAMQSAMEASNRAHGGEGSSRADPAMHAPAPVVKAAEASEPKKTTARKVSPAPAKARAVKDAKAKAEPKASPTRRSGRKAAAGDLKRISGVGPKLEKMLNEQGVTRVSQIAAWNEADVAKFDQALDLDGRISRDDWVGQAGKLAK